MARIGILADYNSQSETHIATDKCLALAAVNLGVDVHGEWVPTQLISKTDIGSFDGLIVNTGVYDDRDAVLNTLRIAREGNIPTLATCGGFQHMIIEYARNVLGLNGVGHAEFDLDSTDHIIVPLQCSLRGREADIAIVLDSQVGRLCKSNAVTEKFYCSFGISPAYLEQLGHSPLRIVGTDDDGLVRVTELPGHPFFIGTLFVPQARALRGEVHPLVFGLVESAIKR